METELIPRKCPFCGHEPDTHAYRDRNNKLDMFVISCYNEYCMIQPSIHMYGPKSQRDAVRYWNAEEELPYG